MKTKQIPELFLLSHVCSWKILLVVFDLRIWTAKVGMTTPRLRCLSHWSSKFKSKDLLNLWWIKM